jgi:hypothetical protein
VLRLLRSSFAWRVAPRWYVLALVLVPTLAVALALAASGLPTVGSLGAAAGAFAVQLLIAFVFDNWWEEVAWAGFVGVRLEEPSTSHSIHVVGIALVGLAVLAATRAGLAHRADSLARP